MAGAMMEQLAIPRSTALSESRQLQPIPPEENGDVKPSVLPERDIIAVQSPVRVAWKVAVIHMPANIRWNTDLRNW
jgi:hypothetical protein